MNTLVLSLILVTSSIFALLDEHTHELSRVEKSKIFEIAPLFPKSLRNFKNHSVISDSGSDSNIQSKREELYHKSRRDTDSEAIILHVNFPSYVPTYSPSISSTYGSLFHTSTSSSTAIRNNSSNVAKANTSNAISALWIDIFSLFVCY